MFDWLFESRLEVYLPLLLLGGLLLYLFGQSRNPRLLRAVVVLAALAGLYFLLGLLVQTPREQIVGRVNDIADGVSKKDLDRVFTHLSESFQMMGMDRRTMKERATDAQRRYDIRNMRVWDVKVEALDKEGGKAKVRFFVKADSTLSGGEFLLCRADFVRDPDGQWRMKTFSLHNPYSDSESSIPLPL